MFLLLGEKGGVKSSRKITFDCQLAVHLDMYGLLHDRRPPFITVEPDKSTD